MEINGNHVARALARLISLASRPHTHIPIRVEQGEIVYIEDRD